MSSTGNGSPWKELQGSQRRRTRRCVGPRVVCEGQCCHPDGGGSRSPALPAEARGTQRGGGRRRRGRLRALHVDEALTDIAARLARLKRDHGAECFGILSPQAFPVLGTLGRRFLNVYGSPNYLHSGICALQRRASKNVSIGRATCAPAQLDKTKPAGQLGSEPGKLGRGAKRDSSAPGCAGCRHAGPSTSVLWPIRSRRGRTCGFRCVREPTARWRSPSCRHHRRRPL